MRKRENKHPPLHVIIKFIFTGFYSRTVITSVRITYFLQVFPCSSSSKTLTLLHTLPRKRLKVLSKRLYLNKQKMRMIKNSSLHQTFLSFNSQVWPNIRGTQIVNDAKSIRKCYACEWKTAKIKEKAISLSLLSDFYNLY